MTDQPRGQMRRRAIRELRCNYTRKGVWLCLRRTYPPPYTGNKRPGWWNLLFHPERLYRQAASLSEGIFT